MKHILTLVVEYVGTGNAGREVDALLGDFEARVNEHPDFVALVAMWEPDLPTDEKCERCDRRRCSHQ